MNGTLLDPYTHPADRALLGATPMLMAPRFGTLAPPPPDTARFLAASNGIYIQASTQAVVATHQIAECSLPYGSATNEVRLVGGRIPRSLLDEATTLARASLPNEWAGLILWDMSSGQYRLWTPPANQSRATPGSCHYSVDAVDPSTIVVDLHSHGRMKAFFSATDDRDDLASPTRAFISMVLGRLHFEEPSICARLVINGHLIPIHQMPFER